MTRRAVTFVLAYEHFEQVIQAQSFEKSTRLIVCQREVGLASEATWKIRDRIGEESNMGTKMIRKECRSIAEGPKNHASCYYKQYSSTHKSLSWRGATPWRTRVSRSNPFILAFRVSWEIQKCSSFAQEEKSTKVRKQETLPRSSKFAKSSETNTRSTKPMVKTSKMCNN